MAKQDEEPNPESELYLAYYPDEISNTEESLKVPLSTLVTIFVIKFAENFDKERKSEVKVILKPERSAKEDITFTLKRDCLDFYSILSEERDEVKKSKSDLVNSCVLPAIYVPAYRLCITGLCSGKEEESTMLYNDSYISLDKTC
jgi:hypothetical protein